MRIRVLFAAVTICTAAAVYGQAPPPVSEKVLQEMSISPLGSFWIENPLGPIAITGSDIERITVTAIKTIAVTDRAALDDARANCVVSFEGDDKVRYVRTLVRPVPFARCSVSYSVQLPRSTDVKVAANLGDVTVRNVNGGVTVKSFASNVHFAGVTGASAIDITRGHIIFELARTPISNSQMTVVAGDIDVYVPPDANFEWVANSLAGDVMTTMPFRGAFTNGIFHGHVNSPGGATINTQSVMGKVRMLARGTNPIESRSVRVPRGETVSPPGQKYGLAPTAKLQMPIVGGAFIFESPDRIIDVSIGEIRGPARVDIAAGAIELQTVFGDCSVSTQGGPINLGEIMGSIDAQTGGGDILVRAARVGGELRTGGGSIRLLYTGGPTNLQSRGGDIIVRQAAGPITAQTPSGDITITLDPGIRTQRVDARTAKGNIVVNITPRFAGDIDATILTASPDANAIHSDFPALSIRREQVGGKTRIRAMGKINGGGERVELYVEDGDITINSQAQSPVTVVTPPAR